MLVDSSNSSQVNKSKKIKRANKLKNPGYTLYYKPIRQGMRTRSGKMINCIANNKEFYTDITYILKLLKIVINPCVIIDNLYNFLDKYCEIIYKEEYLIKLHYDFKTSLSNIDNLIVNKINDNKICSCHDYVIKTIINSAINIKLNVEEASIFINMNHKCSEQHNIVDTLKQLRKYKLKYLPYHSTHKFIYKSLVYKLNEDSVNKIFEYL